jgi:vacuolar-type H+-ATPase subunit H
MALFITSNAHAQQQGRRGGRGGTRGGASQLLQTPEVQKELKLDAAQIDLLKQLNMELREKGQTVFQSAQGLSPEERDKKISEFRVESEKKVGEILDAKQKSRLHQLELQQSGMRGLSRPDVQDELKLTPDQRAKIKAAVDSEREDMRKAFEGFRAGGQNMTPEQRQEAFKKFGEVRTATDGKLGLVLTDAQKKQYQTMQGAAFTFPERQRGRRPGNNQ